MLRKDGTCWLNYGDAYANDGKWGGSSGGKQAYLDGATRLRNGRSKRTTGLKPKDLMMMPARVALALQSDGWWLRSEIVWHKPNPMPESVTDRPTCAHEKMYLLTKSARYFYDAEAVRTEAPERNNNDRKPASWPTSANYNGQYGPARTDKKRGHGRRHAGFNDRWDAMPKDEQQANGANLRNVWAIATHTYPGAHFATFPPALVEPCIQAGTSEKGCCEQCGKPSGWSPACDCNADTVPCTVLDPFGGAGTVGLVADRLGRDAILIELNPDYADMARERIRADAPLFADVCGGLH